MKSKEENLLYIIPGGLTGMREFCQVSGIVPISFCHWHPSYCPSNASFPPFLLQPLLELFHMVLGGWLRFPLDVRDWARSEYPTPLARVTIQGYGHSPSYPLPLICWGLVWVTSKNSPLGMQRSWYSMRDYWPGGHLTCLCPRASVATRAGYTV